VSLDKKVLVLRRIQVVYHLRISSQQRELAARIHGVHAGRCPVARSISPCVEIATDLQIEET
jgi:organic hydroperoxide reductase OsmC/OhrA